jgi:EpsD family peptidyl-prolyl cis-trans isomerase
MRLVKPFLFLFLIVFLMTNAACSKKNKDDTKKSNSQVVAKVNGEEITIHQVNFQLSQLGQLNQVQAKIASKQILTRLIEQELLKQQALGEKLDKDPVVLQALEATRSQLLAQAYLERLLAKAPKPSVSEIDTFYKEHPELFESRRVFDLQELVIVTNKEKFFEIEAGLKPIKGINEIAIWLRDHHYPFSVNSNAKAAEQLPMELLKKLQLLKAGEVLMVPTQTTFNVIHLAGVDSAPITRAKATPIIEQYFLNQNKTMMAQKEVVKLNDNAKIEFEGMYADMKKSELLQPSANSTVTVVDPQISKNVEEKSAIDKTKQSNKPNANASVMDKGLSGL